MGEDLGDGSVPLNAFSSLIRTGDEEGCLGQASLELDSELRGFEAYTIMKKK